MGETLRNLTSSEWFDYAECKFDNILQMNDNVDLPTITQPSTLSTTNWGSSSFDTNYLQSDLHEVDTVCSTMVNYDLASQIVKFMDIPSLMYARRVCRNWYEAVWERLSDPMEHEALEEYLDNRCNQMFRRRVVVAVRIKPSVGEIEVQGKSVRMPHPFPGVYHAEHIFDKSSSQFDVHHSIRSTVIMSLNKKESSTVFCYGQTGSGKTHTMFGSPNDPWNVGLAGRLCKDLWNIYEQNESAYGVTLSCIEVYNEEINDLNTQFSLKEWCDDRPLPDLAIIKGTNPLRIITKSFESLLNYMYRAIESRRVGQTAFNQKSSRSHAIISVQIYGTTSKLNLIDLAGSERTVNHSAQLMKEASFINKSLSSLGRVIQSLATQNKSNSHIPYRDSQLTWLLKDSINPKSGSAVMLATVDPNYTLETRSTLQYASVYSTLRNPYVLRIQRLKRVLAHQKSLLNKDEMEYQRISMTIRKPTPPTAPPKSSGRRGPRLSKSVLRMIERLYKPATSRIQKQLDDLALTISRRKGTITILEDRVIKLKEQEKEFLSL